MYIPPKNIAHFITQQTNANAITNTDLIQSLWSGYGQLLRCHLEGSDYSSVILKHIAPPATQNHPRGWATDISHQRKLKSYQVESAWYQDWSSKRHDSCRIPKLLGINQSSLETSLLLEDLNTAGYPERLNTVSEQSLKACITWLANFHATMMYRSPETLWEIGTYWHLATRPDELEVLDDRELKKAAAKIDQALNNCKHQTIVHGDAKLANFCFSEDGSKVAAVDFQYVGGGCGMKDLAYFLGSCLSEKECEQRENELLDLYFNEFASACKNTQIDSAKVEKDWRKLYHFAWADFHRFLKGWSPGHWKINSYSERITKSVINQLNS